MPMKRSGRPVTAASRVIEIDEVLEPMMASGLQPLARGRSRILRLTSSILGRRLDDDVGVGEIAALSARPEMRARAASTRLAVEQAALDGCGAFATPISAMPASMRSGDTSLSATSKPGERADMGDALAHLARADDADLANFKAHFRPPSANKPAPNRRAARRAAKSVAAVQYKRALGWKENTEKIEKRSRRRGAFERVAAPDQRPIDPIFASSASSSGSAAKRSATRP